ncbi:acylphosphatase [Thalassospiraceae bacterium LMO-JJ14]|nr:acylphosphatase [Thalassospiraceae bacterium LMO-JJ14]
MPARAVHVYIEGRVQGVWYRGWTVQQAENLGLAGWVRNRRDGRVEAVFCGDTDAIDTMITLCRSGPPLARVDNIIVSQAKADGLGSFDTRPTV